MIGLDHPYYARDSSRDQLQVFLKFLKIYHSLLYVCDQAWNHNSHPTYACDVKENNFKVFTEPITSPLTAVMIFSSMFTPVILGKKF